MPAPAKNRAASKASRTRTGRGISPVLLRQRRRLPAGLHGAAIPPEGDGIGGALVPGERASHKSDPAVPEQVPRSASDMAGVPALDRVPHELSRANRFKRDDEVKSGCPGNPGPGKKLTATMSRSPSPSKSAATARYTPGMAASS